MDKKVNKIDKAASKPQQTSKTKQKTPQWIRDIAAGSKKNNESPSQIDKPQIVESNISNNQSRPNIKKTFIMKDEDNEVDTQKLNSLKHKLLEIEKLRQADKKKVLEIEKNIQSDEEKFDKLLNDKFNN